VMSVEGPPGTDDTITDDAMLDTLHNSKANRKLFSTQTWYKVVLHSLFAMNDLSMHHPASRIFHRIENTTAIQLRLLLVLLFPSALCPNIFLLITSAAPSDNVWLLDWGLPLEPLSGYCCLCPFFEPNKDERNLELFRGEGAG